MSELLLKDEFETLKIIQNAVTNVLKKEGKFPDFRDIVVAKNVITSNVLIHFTTGNVLEKVLEMEIILLETTFKIKFRDKATGNEVAGVL